MAPTVIIFGPTGSIGSITSLTAHDTNPATKVILAMRDPSKPIPHLSRTSEEESGRYERVQADLTSPTSITAAITKTKATRAFIYVAHGTPDHMRSSLKAMKDAGVDFVVLLSSYTVHGDPREFTPRDLIPYMHAQVEVALDEVYGAENYVAVRPGGFATNMVRFRSGVEKGEVRLYEAPIRFDCVTPGDMGRVSGRILVEGPKEGRRKVYVYGPQRVTQREALGVVARVLGREIKVTGIGEEEARVQFEEQGFPKPLIEYMVRIFGGAREAGEVPMPTDYEQGVRNVELYTGRKSMGFEEWVGENRELFGA